MTAKKTKTWLCSNLNPAQGGKHLQILLISQFGKVSYTCTLLFLVPLFTSISVSSGRVSRWIPQSLLLTSSTGSTPRQSASSLSDMTKTFLYMQLRQVLTALNEMIWSLSSDSFNNTLHRECITLSLQRPSVSQTLPVHCLCLQTLNRRGCLPSAAGGGRRISLVWVSVLRLVIFQLLLFFFRFPNEDEVKTCNPPFRGQLNVTAVSIPPHKNS